MTLGEEASGSNKPLTSKRYAPAYAAKNGKSRTIFTSPLLPLLEQNATALHGYIA